MRLILTLTIFCLAVALAARAQTGPLLPYKSAHWKQTITAKGATPEKSLKVEAELWYLAPDRVRVVRTVEGRAEVYLIKGATALAYEEGSEVGFKMPMPQQLLDLLAQIAEMTTKLDGWKKSKIGAETIDGKNCDIYGFTDSEGGQSVSRKVWLWAEKKFPVRLLTESQGQSTLIEHSDVELNGDVPASLFDPPPKMEFKDFPAARSTAR